MFYSKVFRCLVVLSIIFFSFFIPFQNLTFREIMRGQFEQNKVFAASTVAFDAVSSGNLDNAALVSFSHTVTSVSGAHPILLCAVGDLGNQSVTSIAYNNVSLTQVTTVNDPVNQVLRMEIWKLVAPPTGAHSVDVTMSGSTLGGAFCESFTGADQTVGLDSSNTNGGTAPSYGSPSTTVVTTSTTGEMIFDALIEHNASVVTPNVGQSQDAYSNEAFASHATASNPNTTTGWTFDDVYTWAEAAVSVKAFPGSDITSPSTPTNLSATAISLSAINLSWTASTDDTAVTGYIVRRGGIQIGASATNSYQDSGLNSSTAYTYTVSAYDAANNNSSQSSPATAQTQSSGGGSGPPPRPALPIISSFTASSTSITYGQSTTLSYTVSGATAISIDNGLDNQSTLTSGAVSVSPASSTTYTLTATNNSGSVTAQVTVSVNSHQDNTPPVAQITSPLAGTVSGTITFSASAIDLIISNQITSGIKTLSLLIDGNVFATTTSAGISQPLDTTTLSNASHSLTAKALDNAGNTFTTATTSIMVNNLASLGYPRKVKLTSLEGLSAVPANIPITAIISSPSSGVTLEIQSNLIPDASGNYTIAFLSTDSRIVNIRIMVSGHLLALIPNVDTAQSVSTAFIIPQLLAGDLNNDNTVNSLDFSFMNNHWNQSFVAADINADGTVNLLDYGLLRNNYNKDGQ